MTDRLPASAEIAEAGEFVAQVREQLQALGDPEKAAPMAAYMRGQFVFLGIPTPQRRLKTQALIRAFTGDPVAAASALWALPQREYQYVAVDLLRRRSRQLASKHLAALEDLVLDKSWWDTVDGLAVTMGGIVLGEPARAERMGELIDSSEMWLRRVALLHQLEYKERTDEQRLFRYCRLCAHEPEFFIRKAIGWALRQYARTNPAAVRQFLTINRAQLSGLSLREAAKHL
ncbi:DNA alkylation repair protein [Dechloromonas sp. A34]|uniref:DNA alkylation repair protein n=1 Tax=Dechloromonas sp. A34 TaxID=447588 RepID=UPI0022491EBD|nr:DNA alkylation repair protein [Dechloromonas sp. A34]